MPLEHQERLESLRQEYRQEFPSHIRFLEECWKKISNQESTQETWDAFYNRAHQLAGSGSTFGFAKVSRLAGLLQNLIKQLRSLSSVSLREKKDLESLLLALKNPF
ncbi:MAG: Hpt domain-containing protein [Deltaproteobacteria bacterium]|nr:Hpt domain-containing protein [Deltaproteobacteria bacterium]